MSNRKLNLELDTLPEIPSRLLYISSSKYENDWTSFLHSHYFTEIFYIKGGVGYIQIENEQIPVSANTLVLIGARVQHTEISTPSTRWTTMCWVWKDSKSTRTGLLNIALSIPPPPPLSFTSALRTFIMRCMVKNRGTQKSASTIWQFCFNCSADNCNLTKYYLSHKFSELYGKSPISYLTEVRISVAKDLLKTTNHSIEEIASTTGFSSSSYFSQTFQKICKMSPQQYRKNQSADT